MEIIGVSQEQGRRRFYFLAVFSNLSGIHMENPRKSLSYPKAATFDAVQRHNDWEQYRLVHGRVNNCTSLWKNICPFRAFPCFPPSWDGPLPKWGPKIYVYIILKHMVLFSNYFSLTSVESIMRSMKVVKENLQGAVKRLPECKQSHWANTGWLNIWTKSTH